ncbi:MAG: 5-deoxy-glucuronate isomerase [Planctomycetota bacterium]|jgi:hypothetical protein
MPNLIRKPLTRGMTIISGIEESLLHGLSMGIISLKEGDRFGETLNCREAVLVLLHGSIKMRGEGFDHGEISARDTVFGGAPAAAYCPPGMYSIKARTDCSLAVFRYELDKKNKGAPPLLIQPQDLNETTSGEGEAAIRRRTLCDLSGSTSGLQIGETVIGPQASGAPMDFQTQVQSGTSSGLMLFCFDEGMGTGTLKANEGDISVEDNDTVALLPGDQSGDFSPDGKPVYCLWAVANA